jgi:hypothetical protein
MNNEALYAWRHTLRPPCHWSFPHSSFANDFARTCQSADTLLWKNWLMYSLRVDPIWWMGSLRVCLAQKPASWKFQEQLLYRFYLGLNFSRIWSVLIATAVKNCCPLDERSRAFTFTKFIIYILALCKFLNRKIWRLWIAEILRDWEMFWNSKQAPKEWVINYCNSGVQKMSA